MNIKLPDKVREYFDSGRKKTVEVLPCDDYTLNVTFDNDEIRIYDMSDKLVGIFEILKDKAKFYEVFIDEVGNIAWDKDKNIDSEKVWNNRIDICADSVYIDSKPQ